MKITVGIPHYNNKEGVTRLLVALISQKHINSDDLEIILVNDGQESFIVKDQLPIFKYFGGTLKIINQPVRFGAAASRNRALECSTGEIILYLDSDTIPSEEWVYSFRKAFISFSNLIGVGGAIVPKVQGNGLVNKYFNATNRLATPIIKNRQIVTILTANCGFRTQFIKKLGGFRDDIFNLSNGLPAGGEDVDLTIRMRKAGYYLQYVPQAIVYHTYPTSLLSIYKKYFLYGKAMRTVCILNNIEPRSIGQPSPNFASSLMYIVTALYVLKSDFLKFRSTGNNIWESIFFAIFELIRRISHLHGFLIKRVFY